jgi:DNA-binding response OmpR family regulator
MTALEGSNNNKLAHSSFGLRENMLHVPTKQEHATSTSTSSASSRLMVVDDEADITFTLKKELEQSGFSLEVFNDPIAALSNFKANYYDLVLLDVKMPYMNGFELYQEINKKDKNVKACFVTAYELYYESLKKEYPKLSVGCFISKPFDMNILVDKIKEELTSGGN